MTVGAVVCLLVGGVTAPSALAASSIIRTIAGHTNTTTNFCGDGGQATLACLSNPEDVAIDSAGDIFIADTHNNRIRKLKDGIITTYAGHTTSTAFCGDGGQATSACLSEPQGVSVDPHGDLFIADTGNNRIRKVAPNGIITTVAGKTTTTLYCGDGGQATNACLNQPFDVVVNSNNSIYIADTGNNVIRKIGKNGVITTLVGNGNYGYNGAGCPANPQGVAALSACLAFPESLALDSGNNIYVADTANNRIRFVSVKIITTIAGTGTAGFCGDGGPATSACLNSPRGVAVDTNFNIYIGDTLNNRVRKVNPQGIISTFAGGGSSSNTACGDNGPATSACLLRPEGVTIGNAGNIDISDSGNNRIRHVTHG
jgi:trimeric autotransporter adhesin